MVHSPCGVKSAFAFPTRCLDTFSLGKGKGRLDPNHTGHTYPVANDPQLTLLLVSIDDAMHVAWRTSFGDLAHVEVTHGNILEVNCDAVVSPANSFGFMDGGIDGVYRNHFGPSIETRVRRQILDHHGGELVVGNADIVETDDTDIAFLIAAPTMRVPMELGESVNPYLAARAVFRLVTQGRFSSGTFVGERVADRVRRIAMPGLGTGIGGTAPETCATQVRAAYSDIVLNQYEIPNSWAQASERHELLCTDRSR